MPTETLTSRERVIRALRRQPVDRMPIDLGMHYSTGISAFAYWNLREYLGLSTERIDIPDMVQFLARVDEDILERFHCDCLLLRPAWPKTQRWNPRGKYQFNIPATAQPVLNSEGDWVVERHGSSMRMPPGGFFFDGAWPGFFDGSEDEWIAATAREAERIYKETQFATMYIGFGGYFSSDPDWLCQMLESPEEIKAGNAAACERDLKVAAKIIDSMGAYIQGICLNADLGSQKGPMCRPSLYEELCAPYMKRLCSFIHQHSDCKIFYHCCGSIKPLLPALIDVGIDVLNPVQISAQDMDPSEIKRKYGDKLSFWGGGCDTQNVLTHGTPEEVAANVRKLSSVFKPGQGFVFNQVHNVMGDVPPQNVVAMLETAYAQSWYPADLV